MRYKPRIARDVFPVTSSGATGGRCNEELVAFIVVALLVFFIITQPETAADTVTAIAAALVSIFESFITFFEDLV